MTEEDCDYCGAPDARKMRPIGFTDLGGKQYPLIKLWCGDCEPDDKCDPEAWKALVNAIGSRSGRSS